MKIYTRTGDRGETHLLGGERVSKSNDRIEAYGDVDELNSVLGALETHLPEGSTALSAEIRRVQSDLLRVGARLATTSDSPSASALEDVAGKETKRLEEAIDRMTAGLPEIKGFILPGGHPSSAWAHVARTVCRRAERRVVHLATAGGTRPVATEYYDPLGYLNRLSDYLFTLARYCNHLAGIPEVTG
jgi:cob(I)alamin adenosyltransferase